MNTLRQLQLNNELNRIVNNIVRLYNPVKIILFGSVANNNISEYSDIDLVVIKNTDKPFYERLEEVIEIAQPNVGADILVYTPDEEREMQKDLFYKEEVLKKGRVIFVEQQMV